MEGRKYNESSFAGLVPSENVDRRSRERTGLDDLIWKLRADYSSAHIEDLATVQKIDEVREIITNKIEEDPDLPLDLNIVMTSEDEKHIANMLTGEHSSDSAEEIVNQIIEFYKSK